MTAKLSLPLREGQRIVCRDGRLATVVYVEERGDEKYRTANILIDGTEEVWKDALWVYNGKGNHYPDKSPNWQDAMADVEVLPGNLTYPFKEGQRVVIRDGQIVTIKRVETNGLVDTSIGTSTVYDTTKFGHGRGYSTEQESDYDFMRDALDDE